METPPTTPRPTELPDSPKDTTAIIWNYSLITIFSIAAVIDICLIAMIAGYFDAGLGAAGLLAIQNLASLFLRRDEQRHNQQQTNTP